MINLANGKLEMDQKGHFQLVELNDNCIKYCLEEPINGQNITAFWSVNKIRHRDDGRGYRFELKITIRRLRNGRFDGKRSAEQNPTTRSFLVRDQDYPKYFENGTKKKEDKMEKRLFTTQYDKAEYPFDLDYRAQSNQHDRSIDSLNTGEYYAKGSAPVIRYQAHHPDAQSTVEDANHIHHHYYLNKQEVPLFKATQFEKVSGFPSNPLHLVHPGHPVHELNSISFPNQVRPSQVSMPRIHSQLDSYGEVIPTTSQPPIHFPEPIKFDDEIRPTTYRGHYDDNRESILQDEENRNHFEPPNNRNTLVSFPARHASIIPVSNINTTPSSFALNLHTSASPSIHSFYNKQLLNPLQSPLHPHQFYWLGQHPQNPNFIPSFPYQENTFSELDPVFHGQTVLTTPSGLTHSHFPDLNSEVHDSGARFVSDLPLQNPDEDFSYDTPTEFHQTTTTNTEPSFTTPLNIVSTTKRGIIKAHSSVDDTPNSYPDSINAQLPPPESGADVRVPYIDVGKSKYSRRGNGKKSEKLSIANDDATLSVEKLNNESVEEQPKKKPSSKYKSQRNSGSTEKPSWAPKRPRLRNSDKYKTHSEMMKSTSKKPNIANRRKIIVRKIITTTTTAEPNTVTSDRPDTTTTDNESLTTTDLSQVDDEPRTTQSVRKSVSVHIGEKVTVMPKKLTRVVLSSKNGEANKKPNRTAKIRKVEKSNEDVTEDYLEQ